MLGQTETTRVRINTGEYNKANACPLKYLLIVSWKCIYSADICYINWALYSDISTRCTFPQPSLIPSLLFSIRSHNFHKRKWDHTSRTCRRWAFLFWGFGVINQCLCDCSEHIRGKVDWGHGSALPLQTQKSVTNLGCLGTPCPHISPSGFQRPNLAELTVGSQECGPSTTPDDGLYC